MAYISSQMTIEEEDELKKLFTSFDENGDGKISKEELVRGFSRMSLKIDVDAVLRSCDSDGNGYIEYTEFLTAANNWRSELSESRLKSVFDAFDVDGNGTISVDEFKALIDDSDDLWEMIIKKVDKNGDGVIDFNEFRRSLKKRIKRKKHKKKHSTVRRSKKSLRTKSSI